MYYVIMNAAYVGRVLMSAKRNKLKMVKKKATIPLVDDIQHLNVPCKTMTVAQYGIFSYNGCFDNAHDIFVSYCRILNEKDFKIIF